MSNDTKQILNHLVDVCEDAREYYQKASDQAEDPRIKMTMKNMAAVRETIISDLKARIISMGGTPDEQGTAQGKTAQFFGQLKASIANTDETLVSELEEAEDKSLEEFHSAMAKNLPEETRSFIEKQTALLRKTHDHMKELKDCMKDAA